MNAITRSFDATPAVRKQVPLLIGIMSPSGGGKTFSALRLATGIQQVVGGDIYGLDTENGRMLHYADQFKFKHVPFSAPFGSLDYLAALKYCTAQGSRITIVDSMTHEHVGEGGYLDTAESVVDRIAGNDYKKREAVKMLGWAKAGPLRQKMIEGIKQLDGAFIFCFRAKEKVKPIKNAEGKTEVVDMGFMPIAGEEWIYEMSLNCMLEPRSEGVPTWRSDHLGERLMMKLPSQFKNIFAERQPLSEDIGRAMAEWAKGGAETAPASAPARQFSASEPSRDLIGLGNAAADCGTEALRQFWTSLSKADKAAVGGAAQLDVWKKTAAEAETPDIGFDEPTNESADSSAATDGAATSSQVASSGTDPSSAEQASGGKPKPAGRAGDSKGAAASVSGKDAAPDLLAELTRAAKAGVFETRKWLQEHEGAVKVLGTPAIELALSAAHETDAAIERETAG